MRIINQKCRVVLLTMLFSILFLSACTWSDPLQVEDDFGSSVRHMVEQQKQATETAHTATERKPTGIDGDSVLNSLEKYRAAQKRKTQKESLNSFALGD